MAQIVVIAGSPGAGKTTLLESLKGYKIVNVGTIMFKHALSMRSVKDRDEIRYLSNGLVDQLRLAAFKEISKMKGIVLVDTHASVERNGKFVPGTPRNALETLGLRNIKAFIYIDAPTKDILERRLKDKKRKREIEKAEIIDAQRVVNLSILSAYSADLNIPLYIIINKQGKLEESKANLKAYLNEIFS